METYESIKEKVRQERSQTPGNIVDSSYINSFFTDAKNFVDTQNTTLEKADWASSTNADAYKSRGESLFDLTSRADRIRKYLEDNKSGMKAEDYDRLSSSLDQYNQAFSAVRGISENNKAFYSQFDSQEQYDKYIEDQKNKTQKDRQKDRWGYTIPDKSHTYTYAISPSEEEDTGLFKSGAFDDGYQFGDVTKTAIGTVGDFLGNAAKGFWGMFEGVSDAILHGASGVANLVGADDVASYLKNEANYETVEKGFAPFLNAVNENSVLGNTMDSVAQSVGNSAALMLPSGVTQGLGLGKKAASLATTGTTFASGLGSGMSEAYNSGKDVSGLEAFSYGVLKGAVEAGTEALFGGIGKGVNALGISHGIGGVDDMIVTKLTEKLTNQTVKSLIGLGVKYVGEGVEEVLAGFGTAVSKWLTYMSEEDLGKLIEDENLMESFVVGLLSSAISQSPDVVGSIKSGNEFVPEITANDGTAPKAEMPEVTAPSVNTIVPAGIATPTVTATPSQQTDALANVEDLLRAAKPDPVADATKAFKESGVVSNSKAEAILASPEALQQLTEQTGIPIEGTKSQQRAAVKEAVAKLNEQNAEGGSVPVAEESAVTEESSVAPVVSETVEQPVATTESAPSPNESVGAAPAGFDQYSNLQYQYGNKPDRSNTVRDINVPNRDSQGRRVSDYAANIYGNEITSDQMIPELEKRIAAGEFGADVKHLTDTKENSFKHINDVGIEKSADEVKDAVSTGKYSDDLLAQAQILYANYQAKGDMVKAGDMAVYAAEIARAGGRILNVAKMTRMLTPDGQLEARLRLAELADQRIKKKKKNAKAVSVSKDTQQKFKNVSTAGETVITDAANELSDAAKVDYAAAAKSAMEKASAKNPEIADQISKAELTPEQKGILYGDRIVKANETKAEAEEVTEDEVYNAIMAFVDSKKKKTASPKTKKAALDALAQYYGNKAEFQEVWSAARRRAEANLARDVKATEALQQFFDTGAMAQDVMDAQDANSVSGKAIRQAAKGAGVDLQSLIAKSAEDKAAALAEIQKYVQSTYNLDEASASEMATQLQESFFEELSRRQTKRLLSMFGQKDAAPKTQQSVMDKFRELYRLGAFTKDAFISREALKKLFGADGLTLSDEVLQQYGEISDARKAEIDQRILQEIADQIPSSFAEVYRKWRYTSMLANPSTHIRNMSGNFGMFLMQYGLKDSVAAGIETVGSVVSGGKMKRTKSFLNPLSKKDGQLVSNAWNDYGTIMNNNGEVAQRIKNGGKYYSPQSEIQKLKKTFAPLDAVSNFNTAAMDAEDAIFGRTAYSLSLAGYMKANKLTEITEEARAYAISQAQEATFHDDSLIYQKVRNLIKDGNVVVPFVKTPSNVTSRAIEYSPGMLIKSGWDIVQAARGKEGYTAAKAINNASKGIVGSALYGVGAWMAAQGLLRVVGAGDDETREYEKMMGYKDFSICIGGTYISADFLTPSIIPLLTGASIWESAQNLSDGNISFTDALNAIYSVTDPIISSSMLSSLDGMMYAIRSMDEAQSGELVGTILLELGKSYISQSIPSLVRRIASASDNTAREIYQDSENPLDYYWQNIMGSIPGATQNLKTKYDVWGQPFKRNDVGNDAAGWIFSAITPSNIYDVHETPIDEEILRLQKAGFDALPSANPKTITIDGEKVRLTQDQYETYERVEGQTAYAFAEQIMDSDSYKAMTDEQKSDVLNAAYKVANELGKIAALGDSYTPDNSGIHKYYAMAEENGIDPQVFFTDVYAKYKIIGDSDEKPSRKAQQFASYLEKLEAGGVITEEQKAVIKNTMKFYNMSPADTVVYDRFVESGVEPENADYIMDLFGGLTPEEGYTSVRPVQKYEAIAGAEGFTEEEKIAAMKAQITDEKLEAKFDMAIDRGYDTEDFADAYRANLENKKKNDFRNSMIEMGYTAAQAMWFYNLYHGK